MRGAEEILVNDSHDAGRIGRTILVEGPRAGVRLCRGIERPFWLPGLDASCGALLHIGMHAKANTPYGALTHTCSSDVRGHRVNGASVGERDIAAAIAEYFRGASGVRLRGSLRLP